MFSITKYVVNKIRENKKNFPLQKKIIKKQIMDNDQKQLLSFVFVILSEYLLFSTVEQKEEYMKGISYQTGFSLLRYFIYYVISTR